MYDPTVTPPRTKQQLLTYLLMYGYLAGLGAAGLMFFLVLIVWPQWRMNSLFIEAEGLVVGEREVWGEGGSSRQLRLRYAVRGVDVEHWNSDLTVGMDEGQIQQRIRALAVGERIRVWYDPASPEIVVLGRGYWILWMLYPILFGSGFFLLYGVGKVVGGVKAWLSCRQGGPNTSPPQPGDGVRQPEAHRPAGGRGC